MNYNQNTANIKQEYNGISLDYTLLDVSKALPSKGYFYPFKEIYIRGLRFREQLEITQINKIKDNKQSFKSIMRIYKECVKTENNTPFTDLLQEDLYAICLWIILMTDRDQKWKMSATCQKCKTTTSFEINPSKDLNLVEFKITEPQSITTEIGTLIIAPMTIQDGIDFDELETDFKDELYNAQMVKKLDGKALSLQERIDTYGMLSMSDIGRVDNICKDLKSYMSDVNKVCPKCSEGIILVPMVDIKKGLP